MLRKNLIDILYVIRDETETLKPGLHGGVNDGSTNGKDENGLGVSIVAKYDTQVLFLF